MRGFRSTKGQKKRKKAEINHQDSSSFKNANPIKAKRKCYSLGVPLFLAFLPRGMRSEVVTAGVSS